MKKAQFLFVLSIITCFSYSQNQSGGGYYGDYLLFKDTFYDYSIFLGVDTFAIFNYYLDETGNDNIPTSDVISIPMEYYGKVKSESDTIILNWSGEVLFRFSIIDSLRLSVFYSKNNIMNGDTAIRVESLEFSDNKYWSKWKYTLVGGDLGLFLGATNNSHLFYPRFYFYNEDGILLKEVEDTNQIHPFTKYLLK